MPIGNEKTTLKNNEKKSEGKIPTAFTFHLRSGKDEYRYYPLHKRITLRK